MKITRGIVMQKIEMPDREIMILSKKKERKNSIGSSITRDFELIGSRLTPENVTTEKLIKNCLKTRQKLAKLKKNSKKMVKKNDTQCN